MSSRIKQRLSYSNVSAVGTKNSTWAAVLPAAVVALVTLLPGAAHAGQETKLNSTKQIQLKCGADQHGCGRVVAVENVTAVKDSPRRPWGRQSVIQLHPFTSGGRFHTTTENPAATRICTQLRIIFRAKGQIATAGPFGAAGLELDDYKVSTTHNTSILAGYKCRNINAYMGSINVKSDMAYIDTAGPAIEKITIKARTTLYFWANHYYTTPWAKDTIDFG